MWPIPRTIQNIAHAGNPSPRPPSRESRLEKAASLAPFLPWRRGNQKEATIDLVTPPTKLVAKEEEEESAQSQSTRSGTIWEQKMF